VYWNSAPWFKAGCPAVYTSSTPIQNMRMDHRAADVIVPQQFLEPLF
jgi:hypothetical protein